MALLGGLLGVDATRKGTVAATLYDLRQQAATRVRHDDREVAVLAATDHDPHSELFPSADASAARFLIRSTVRLLHDLEFTPHDDIAVGWLSIGAIRANRDLSPLANRLALADHVEYIWAAASLGHPLRVHRDFVVRSAVLGLGDALNAEEEADNRPADSVELWLRLADIRQQRR